MSDISALYSSPYYPNAPQTNWAMTTFDTTPYTGGDLNGAPSNFGLAGDYYGDSLSGWLTPTVTTNYYFYLATDDDGELDLNATGPDPQGASSIAQSGCCPGFQEPGNASTAGPFLLTAGTSYFIRAQHVEGGGGDYVKVAWKMEGDTTAAASLKPIPGTYFSSYAPSPVPPAFIPPAFSNGQLTISWTGAGTLYESTNIALPLSQWTLVPNVTGSSYTVTPGTNGPQTFYRVKQ